MICSLYLCRNITHIMDMNKLKTILLALLAVTMTAQAGNGQEGVSGNYLRKAGWRSSCSG